MKCCQECSLQGQCAADCEVRGKCGYYPCFPCGEKHPPKEPQSSK